MGSVTHFEIYASEPEKLADFYRTMFGWQLEKAPGIDYWRIQTESSPFVGSTSKVYSGLGADIVMGLVSSIVWHLG
jgi:predicted enzyme related to lactoylglutathione lyase